MTKITKNVSIMCFHGELCQVYNALMTALSLLGEGSKVTIFLGQGALMPFIKTNQTSLNVFLTCRKRPVMQL